MGLQGMLLHLLALWLCSTTIITSRATLAKLRQPGNSVNKESLQYVSNSLASSLFSYAKTLKGKPLPGRVDFALVLDSSYGLGGRDGFHSAHALARRLISEFSVSPSTTRVALVTCATRPSLYFGLEDHVNKEATLEALKTARFERDLQCSLHSALNVVNDVVFKKQPPFRHTNRLVVLVTRNTAHDGPQAIAAAKRLKSKGARVFRIAVDHHRPSNGADKLASLPSSKYSFSVPSWKDLKNLADSLRSKGHHLSCSANSEHATDECNRLCKCSEGGQLYACARVRKDFPSMPLEERARYISALKEHMTRNQFLLIKRCKCQHCSKENLSGALEHRCCMEVLNFQGKLVFDGSIEHLSCIVQHEDYKAITNRAVLEQVAPLLKGTTGRSYRRRAGVTQNEFLRAVAYRWVIRWLCGYMGWENTRPLSACIYQDIRTRYQTRHLQPRGYNPNRGDGEN